MDLWVDVGICNVNADDLETIKMKIGKTNVKVINVIIVWRNDNKFI